jgi:hypothetical protein
MNNPILMRKIQFLLVVAASAIFSNFARAQDSNAVPIYTQLEAFEAQVDTVIVKGSGLIGTVAAKGGTLSITCKESQSVATGQRAYGIAIGVRIGTAPEDITILDYDELNAFFDALDFLSKANTQLTSLPTFHANFMTKAGLKISSYTSSKRAGVIQAALAGSHLPKSRVLLEPDQMDHFKSLIREAISQLDGLQGKTP